MKDQGRLMNNNIWCIFWFYGPVFLFFLCLYRTTTKYSPTVHCRPLHSTADQLQDHSTQAAIAMIAGFGGLCMALQRGAGNVASDITVVDESEADNPSPNAHAEDLARSILDVCVDDSH